MGVIAKINPFFIIFTEIYPYFEAEKVPLFRKNVVQACGPLGHQRGGAGSVLNGLSIGEKRYCILKSSFCSSRGWDGPKIKWVSIANHSSYT
jgi:hypothetical protein